jgi:hypothetical protein
MPVVTLPDFQRHYRTVQHDEEHVAALYTVLGIDYAAVRAEDRARAEELARERGWRLL